jgi:hypothetical protein
MTALIGTQSVTGPMGPAGFLFFILGVVVVAIWWSQRNEP